MQIATCLWFNDQAKEASKFYATVFANSKVGRIAHYTKASSQASGQKAGSVLTVELQIENLHVLCLNGGPQFKFTPALSYFVSCSSEAEINEKWQRLSEGGQLRMGLDKYPWAEKYGWVADRYGVEWQLILAPSKEKISPAFLFVEQLFGKGEEALNFYMSLFPNSKIDSIVRDEASKTIMHCSFTLNGQSFALMEGAGTHGFTFSHATSLVAMCDTQNEIDQLWSKLAAGGSIEQCGWLKDKYGVSWQVTPKIMGDLMTNSETADRAFSAIMKMQKLDIAEIQKAAKS